MARFFVGQRVRIVGCRFPQNSEIIGREERITAFLDDGLVRLTCHPRENGNDRIQARFLEPILPDGHRAGDYSNVRDLMDALSQGVSA